MATTKNGVGKTSAKKVPAAKPAPAAKKGAAAKAKALPTAKQIAEVAGIEMKPLLKPNQVQRLRRALPGYVSLLDDVAALIERDGHELNLKDVTAAELLRVQAQQKELAAKVAALEAVYMTAYHQRLALDHEAMGVLRETAQ